MESVLTGIERLMEAPERLRGAGRLGLLCNPASVDRGLRHARQLLEQRFPGALRALFSPQHGFFAEKQDNMIESADLTDPLLGLPVHSLYGATRVPTAEMFAEIDTLLVDLQDVGTRVYTFAYTLSYCLEAARRYGRRVVVLDRPNPLGGARIEGNLLRPEWASFVGRYPIPMRHGLTLGELALLFNTHFGIGGELEVIPMAGWRREMRFGDTGLPWVAPSPNLPTPASAMVYAGQVLWEGTNLSEGRGTTQPFELFGAPFIEPQDIAQAVGPIAGGFLRPAAFEPTSGKWQGRCCRGFQLHVTDPEPFRPYRTSLKILQAVLRRHPAEFEWRPPPYEYEFEKRPIDLILGDAGVRRRLEGGEPIESLEESWRPELAAFEEIRRSCFLYPAEPARDAGPRRRKAAPE
jgi:uncharacterized protein YbbC (DUF1343 family)